MNLAQVIERANEYAGFWYLGTVYTKHPFGMNAAHVCAVKYAAALMLHGVKVFSPIAHSHFIGTSMPGREHDFWMEVDRPFMEAARGMIYCRMAQHEQSDGLRIELDYFSRARKPILFWDVLDEELDCEIVYNGYNTNDPFA